MAKNAHMPGPLVVERHDQDDGSIAYEIWTADLQHRTVRILDNDNPNARHDANLYAAAPDLLAALKDILSSGANSYRNGDKHDDVVIARLSYEDARAAIAKATGASYG